MMSGMVARRIFPSAIVALTACVAMFGSVFLVYGSTFGHEFVTWDDMGLIKENPHVREMTLATVKHVFSSYDPELYIPLTFLTYQVDYVLGGGSPVPFHLTNIVLHALNALLVMWLLYLLLGNGIIALGLGLLFALHPLNTEAVAWMSARKDTLSTFFFLIALIANLLFDERKDARMYMTSLLAFLLGLLAKVMIVMLPVVLILLDLLRGRPITKRSLIEKVPFFALSVIFGIIALFGKKEILVSSTLWQKILMAGKSTAFYLEKFVLPSGLSVMYPYGKTIKTFSVDFLLPLAITLLLIAAIVWFRKRKRAVSVGLAWFLLTLVPTFTNFAKGGEIYVASDRYAYVPMIGLLIAIGAIASGWLAQSRGVREYASKQRSLGAVTIFVLILFAWRSSVQASTWKTSEALYKNVLRSYPAAQAAHNNLGMEYLLQGKPNDALKQFDLALAIRSDHRTKVNRASALLRKGMVDAAMKEYEEVARLAPDLPDGHYGMGNIHRSSGRLGEAVMQYERALAADPTYTNALNNLGAVYIQLQDWDKAIATLQRSIELHPEFAASYYNLAGAYERSGMKAEAEAAYREAIRLEPEDPDALATLATLVYDRGDIDASAKLLMRALAIRDNNPIAIDLVLRMKADGVAE